MTDGLTSFKRNCDNSKDAHCEQRVLKKKFKIKTWFNQSMVAQMAARSPHDGMVVHSNPAGSYEIALQRMICSISF